jgi:hypothetical protein
MDFGELRSIRISVDVKDTIRILKKNLIKHKAAHEKAMKGWHKKVATLSARVAAAAKKGKLPRKAHMDLARVLSDKPDSYAKTYEASIDLFGHHTEEKILLTSSDCDKLLRDNWDWTESWSTKNSRY